MTSCLVKGFPKTSTWSLWASECWTQLLFHQFLKACFYVLGYLPPICHFITSFAFASDVKVRYNTAG